MPGRSLSATSKPVTVAIVLLATVGWMGLTVSAWNGETPASPSGTTMPTSSALSTGPPVAATPTAGAGPSHVAAISALAEAALASARAAGVRPNFIFVPRPPATADELRSSTESGVVSPLYTGTPAPIGLAYYGLNTTGGGAVAGTILNTTGVQGTVDANATGIAASDLFQSSPDAFGIQLNSVLTNVTLLGKSGYQFWTQNVVEFYPSIGLMSLITNIWNFSGSSISPNAIYAHGPDGINDSGAAGLYYAELQLSGAISYPFNLTLTLNSSISGGRDEVTFGTGLTSTSHPSEDFSFPSWDYAIFNSSVPNLPPALTVPSNFTANGLHYDPVGLTNDFELDICGPGGGSQSDLTTADATLGLATWDGTAWVAVPAAYNYGGETGETATGANVAWSDAPGGPGGLARYGTMSTGPSELTGLWGTGAPVGSDPVTLRISPGNAFNFLAYDGAPGFTSANFIVSEPSYAPTIFTDTLDLMPGTYNLTTELSDFTPVTQLLTVAGPVVVTLALTADAARGVYTPLWAFSNAEVAALATSGSGTPSNPYLIDNRQSAPLASTFGLYNDFTFPVFPGVWFMGTSVSTEFASPANLSTATNDFAYPGNYLPQTNDLQQWFWNVSNVSLLDAHNISGWFGYPTFYPTLFDTFNVIFYQSAHVLVAGDTFDTEAQALLIFAGEADTGPFLSDGGNNTVWGNRFVQIAGPTSCPISNSCIAPIDPALGLGLEIADGFSGAADVVYNNEFLTPTTAWELPLNLYSGNPETFTVAWNITPQAASNAHYAPGFPTVPLSGSILGTTQQGGNYWWDYGNANNEYNGANDPYGVLPYDENSTTYVISLYPPSFYSATWIYPGGDFAPLLPFALTPVVVREGGLVAHTVWGAQVTNVSGLTLYDDFATNASSILLYLPVGHYRFYPTPVSGYAVATQGGFAVSTHPGVVGIPYRVAPGYAIVTFREVGLPAGTDWAVTVNGTSATTDRFNNSSSTVGLRNQFHVLDGNYSYRVPGIPGWAPSTTAGTVTIRGSLIIVVRWTPVRYGVVFSETGLASGAFWAVKVTGPVRGFGTQALAHGSRSGTVAFSLPNGTYSVVVVAPRGYTCTTSSPLTVMGGSIAPAVSCSGGPPPGAPATPLSAPASAASARTPSVESIRSSGG